MMTRTMLTGLVGVLLFGAATAKANPVSDWNAVMLAPVGGQSPFAQPHVRAQRDGVRAKRRRGYTHRPCRAT
jgi:hypothetical protein